MHFGMAKARPLLVTTNFSASASMSESNAECMGVGAGSGDDEMIIEEGTLECGGGSGSGSGSAPESASVPLPPKGETHKMDLKALVEAPLFGDSLPMDMSSVLKEVTVSPGTVRGAELVLKSPLGNLNVVARVLAGKLEHLPGVKPQGQIPVTKETLLASIPLALARPHLDAASTHVISWAGGCFEVTVVKPESVERPSQVTPYSRSPALVLGLVAGTVRVHMSFTTDSSPKPVKEAEPEAGAGPKSKAKSKTPRPTSTSGAVTCITVVTKDGTPVTDSCDLELPGVFALLVDALAAYLLGGRGRECGFVAKHVEEREREEFKSVVAGLMSGCSTALEVYKNALRAEQRANPKPKAAAAPKQTAPAPVCEAAPAAAAPVAPVAPAAPAALPVPPFQWISPLAQPAPAPVVQTVPSDLQALLDLLCSTCRVKTPWQVVGHITGLMAAFGDCETLDGVVKEAVKAKQAQETLKSRLDESSRECAELREKIAALHQKLQVQLVSRAFHDGKAARKGGRKGTQTSAYTRRFLDGVHESGSESELESGSESEPEAKAASAPAPVPVPVPCAPAVGTGQKIVIKGPRGGLKTPAPKTDGRTENKRQRV